MRKFRPALCLVLFSALLFTACKRDMFDADAYKQIVADASAFSDIDPDHTWNLTQSRATVVTANADAEVSRVRILTGNPFGDATAEILAEAATAKGQSATLFYYAPADLTQLYAALETADGQWMVKPFDAGQQRVDFVSGVSVHEAAPRADYLGYTYCFEDTYPEPGDNDFNDLVLRIQKLPAQGQHQIRLRVTLAAVGTQRPLAAAIRLTGYDYDDVESVAVEEGITFDPGYPLDRYFIDSADLLLRGIHGEAVLNLFEDAHYAMNPTVTTSTGGVTSVVRRYCNTQHGGDSLTYLETAPVVRTYVVSLRNPRMLQNFTLEDIDPFVLKDFNSGKWEIHTFAHKADEVMHELGVSQTAASNVMTWALKIPTVAFRHACEANNIGYYKDGILTGAYMTLGHSFGQWVTSRHSSTDWYRYPSTGGVY